MLDAMWRRLADPAEPGTTSRSSRLPPKTGCVEAPADFSFDGAQF